MGCCGGKSKSVPKGIVLNKRMQVALDGGSVVLEYIGNSYGTQTFYGPKTGSQYVAGITKPLVIVDPKDAVTGSTRQPGILEQKENGKPLFRKYVPPKQSVITITDATKTAKVVITEPDTLEEAIIQEEQIQEVEVDQPEFAELVATTSLPKLKEIHINKLAVSNWLRAEKTGRNRKGVIAYLEILTK